MMQSAMSPLEIIYSARKGTSDYDFNSLVELGGGSQGKVSSIKSKIDGRTYAVKQLTSLMYEGGDDVESEVITELVL